MYSLFIIDDHNNFAKTKIEEIHFLNVLPFTILMLEWSSLCQTSNHLYAGQEEKHG